MTRTFSTLWMLAITDFKLRYANSVLGYLWSLLKPLLIFAVLYTVFSVFMRIDIAHYQLHLLLGIILWNFFAESTTVGMNALLSKANLITKIRFPRWIPVVSSTITSFMTLLINLVIFAVFFLVTDLPLHASAILLLLYIAELFVLSLGVSLALSVLYVRYRDLSQIWEVLLQAGFFLSPIVYSLDMVPEQYHTLLLVNPITSLVQYSRHVLIAGEWTSLAGNAASIVGVLVVFGIGFFIFRKRQSHIAEEL